MRLRTEKLRNFLEYTKRVSNYCVVNYETVREFPEEFVHELSEVFQLQKTDEFNPVKEYKGNSKNREYYPKKYRRISQSDLNFINRQLDEKFENEMGYNLIWDADHIDR